MAKIVKRNRFAEVSEDELDSYLERGWILVPEEGPGSAKPKKKKASKKKAEK
tara:strand:+ start:40 stop:195 length:156 start_codon:yes stop_codon:yes gene_type:complete